MDRVLIVDKPRGPTSHDVVKRIRRVTGAKRVGHAGTLDPGATGVLVVLVGKATRLSQFFVEADKVYRGEIVLGTATTTQDAQGEPIGGGSVESVREDDVRQALAGFVGEIEQTPPMISAIKREGTPLYVLARRGVTVKREPRRVRVERFELLRYVPPRIEFEVACSKGTYVRTLAADVGEALGCGGHLGRLVRTRVGHFGIEQAVSLDELERPGQVVGDVGYSMFDALEPWPAVGLCEEEGEVISAGGAVTLSCGRVGAAAGDLLRLTVDGASLLAVGRAGPRDQDGRQPVHPIRVFAPL